MTLCVSQVNAWAIIVQRARRAQRLAQTTSTLNVANALGWIAKSACSVKASSAKRVHASHHLGRNALPASATGLSPLSTCAMGCTAMTIQNALRADVTLASAPITHQPLTHATKTQIMAAGSATKPFAADTSSAKTGPAMMGFATIPIFGLFFWSRSSQRSSSLWHYPASASSARETRNDA